MIRNVTAILSFVLASFCFSSVSPPLRSEEPYFEESFDATAQNPNLEAYDSYFEVVDGKLHRTKPTANDDRRYVRTRLSDYNNRDFVYEVTFTTQADIVFVGLGLGDPGDPPLAYNEPDDSVNFSVLPLVHDGGVHVRTKDGYQKIGRVFSAGPHRARITKIGDSISFELDEKYNGEFEVDIGVTYLDYRGAGPFLHEGNSYLFFGCVNDLEYFDDLVVNSVETEPPDCNANGVDDATDIADESSADAGEDGVPDECQTVQPYFSDNFIENIRNIEGTNTILMTGFSTTDCTPSSAQSLKSARWSWQSNIRIV